MTRLIPAAIVMPLNADFIFRNDLICDYSPPDNQVRERELNHAIVVAE